MPYLPHTLPASHPDPRARRRWQASSPLPAAQSRVSAAPGRSVSLSTPANPKAARAPADPAHAPERLRAHSVDMGGLEQHDPARPSETVRIAGVRPSRPSSAGAGRPNQAARAGYSIDGAPRSARRNSVHFASRAAAAQRAWTEREVSSLAEMSVSFWIRGQGVDYRGVAHYLQRTEKDVRTMLQLMLQENALVAHRSHWADSDQRVVGAWAALEFPQCSTLNLGRTRIRRLSGFSGLDRCLSAMRCRRPSGHESWITDAIAPSPDAAPPASAVVPNVEILESADPIPARSTPPAAADNANAERADTAKPLPALPVGDFTFSSPSVAPATAAAASPTSPKRRRDSTTILLARRAQSQRRRRSDTAAMAPPPAAKAAPSAKRADAATMTSASSLAAMRAGRASVTSAAQHVEAETTTADSAVQEHLQEPAAAAPAMPPAALQVAPAAVPPPNGDASAGEMAASVAGLVESLDDGSRDEWLLPEQSTPPHEVTRIDGDIDMDHLDMSSERRKLIRKFIEDYVAAYFGGFCFRIHRDNIAEALCDIAQCGAIPDLASSKYRIRIEVEMKRLTNCSRSTIDMASANTHFYTYLSRRVCEDHIFPTDTVWGSASKYATTVFNRILEDIHFLAHEGDPRSRGPTWCAAEQRMCTYQRERHLGFVARVAAMTHVRYTGVRLYFDRIEYCGAAPIPAAAEYDDHLGEEDMEREMECSWSNVAMRDTLHTQVMKALPCATNASIMTAMQQAIAAYNMSVVEFVRQSRGCNFLDALDRLPSDTVDVAACEAALNGRHGQALSVTHAGMLAQCLADQWFDSLRSSLLAWLLIDHQFRPVPLSEMRRWIFENQSPRGQDVEFVANLHLYRHVKALGMRISEAKWLYASAVLTLRLIARIRREAARTALLNHVDVHKYTELFAALVEEEARRTAPRKKRSSSSSRRRRHRHLDVPATIAAPEEPPEWLAESSTPLPDAPSQASTEERLARLEAEMAGLRLDFGRQFDRMLTMLEAQSKARA
ncbi:hypothetical protein H4R19_003965 [Coemansia spiralis]|nr:hypothetical protein H4R19_003965 [Coemansia spiralis]